MIVRPIFNLLLFLQIAVFEGIHGLSFTRQDILRLRLTRMDTFDVIGKRECCEKINQWKFENKEDREYRILLDQGMRQICDNNAFPIYINSTNAEYIIINLMVESNVNIINILTNKKNTNTVDKGLVEYHTFLVENGYNPTYHQLKSVNHNQFLTALYLNLLDDRENQMIRLKKKSYLEYLEQDTIYKEQDEEEKGKGKGKKEEKDETL